MNSGLSHLSLRKKTKTHAIDFINDEEILDMAGYFAFLQYKKLLKNDLKNFLVAKGALIYVCLWMVTTYDLALLLSKYM